MDNHLQEGKVWREKEEEVGEEVREAQRSTERRGEESRGERERERRRQEERKEKVQRTFCVGLRLALLCLACRKARFGEKEEEVGEKRR
jgi:hypothetical protein